MRITPAKKLCGLFFFVIVLFIISGFLINGKNWRETFSWDFILFLAERPLSMIWESPEDYVLSRMRACSLESNHNQCYQSRAEDFSNKFTLPEILQIVEEQEQEPEIFTSCHALTHYLGRSAYKKIGNIPDVYTQCTSVCQGGCYHGVIESYFGEQILSLGDVARLAQKVRGACGEERDYGKPLLYTECVHGIGHALMFISQNDLPFALRFCDEFASARERETCYTGVFMENSSSATTIGHPSAFVSVEDPMYPCTILEERYLSECYGAQSSYFTLISHFSWEKTVSLCSQVPLKYQGKCFFTMGRNLVAYTQERKVIKDTCSLPEHSASQNSCIRGAVSSFATRYVHDVARIEAFCSSVNENQKHDCYRELGRYLGVWGFDREKVQSTCLQLKEGKYQYACLQADTSL